MARYDNGCSHNCKDIYAEREIEREERGRESETERERESQDPPCTLK